MKLKNIILSCFVFCNFILFCFNSFAQSTNSPTHTGADTVATHSLQKTLDSISKQKDIIDIAFKITKMKVFVRKPDSIKMKPGKLLISGNPATGYTIQTGITALWTENISFFAGPFNTTNLSTINASPEYSIFDHQIILPVVFSIWTKANKYNFQGDWRFYQYPSYTYGLGGHTSLADRDSINYSYYRIYQQVVKELFPNFYAGVGYALDYHYKITDSGNKTDFQSYNDSATKTVSSGILLNIAYDSRHNNNNPQGGIFASVTYRPNFTFLGSDQNWQMLQFDFRKYFKFPADSKNIFAIWSYDWLTFGKAPYLDLPSTAWDTYSNLARGYIQGRLRAPNLLYMEAEYRISLTRNGLLGCVVFTNAQAVSEYPSNKFETILPAFGTGIRFKLNKYSNVNFAADYAFGTDGSNGIFFNICEVF